MKICHISTAHKNNDDRIFYKECVSLATVGYDVTLIAVGKSDTNQNVKRIGLPQLSRWKRFLFARHLAYKLATQVDADVYHLHDPELLLLVRKFKRKGKQVVFDSHEDYYQQIKIKKYIPLLFRDIIAELFRSYQKYISQFLDGFIFPAENNSLDVQLPITIVNNAPIIGNCSISDNYSPLEQRGDVICYVGGISEDRGIIWLIKAAFLADVKLILAGSFSSNELKNKIMNMPEYACVDYRGIIDYKDIGSIYMESKIGMAVLNNVGQYGTGNNFAIKVMEYCQYGLAVMLNKTPYHQAMIEKYHFGICVEDPTNTKEYAAMIRGLLNSPKLLKDMGKNGREMVEKEFNWNNEFAKLRDLYLSLGLKINNQNFDFLKNS